MSKQKIVPPSLERVLSRLAPLGQEAEETLHAIVLGEADALVIEGEDGPSIYTLKEAAEPYRRLVEQMSEAALVVEAEGAILYSNGRLCQLLGVESLVGSSFLELVAPEQRDQAQKLLSDGALFNANAELSLRSATRNAENVRACAAPLSFNEQRCIALVVTALDDIESLRLSRAVLQEREEKLRLALRAAKLGAFVWHVQTDRAEVDARVLELFGKPQGAALNLKEALTLVHPEDRSRYAEAVARACDPSENGAFHEDFRVLLADGAHRWVEVTGQTYFAGDPPQAVRMIGAARDLTPRKLGEAALRESEAFNRALIEASPDCVEVLDLDGRVRTVNETCRRLLQLDDHFEISDRLWPELWPEAARPRLTEALALAKSGRAARLQEFCPTAAGVPKYWDVILKPVKDARGRVVCLLSVARDVTQSREAELALRKSEERQAYLLNLADALRPLVDPNAIQREAARILGQRLGALRVHFAEVTEDGEWGVVRDDYSDGAPSVIGRYRLDNYGPAAFAEFRAGRPLVVHSVAEDERLSAEVRAATAALRIGAYVFSPLVKDGRPVAAIAVHHAQPHVWTDTELAFINETAERSWAAVERALAEERLARAHERLTATLRASPVAVFEQDRELRYVWILNPALGRRPDEVVGMTDYDLFERAQDADAIVTIKRRVLATGVAARQEVHIFAAGVSRWWDLSVEPRFSGKEIAGVLCTATEVTERMREEERQAYLLRLSDRLRELADPEELQYAAACELGAQLRANRVCYAEDCGDGERIMVARNYVDGVDETQGEFRYADFGSRHFSEFGGGRTSVLPDIANDPSLTADEKTAFAEGQVGAAFGAPLLRGGRLVAVLFVNFREPRVLPENDLALIKETVQRTWEAVERARAEAALRVADRRKDEFLAILAHELRNPLAPIRNAIYTLQKLDAGAGAWREQFPTLIAMMNRQVDNLIRLVDDLLEVSRITRGKISLKKQRVDLRDLICQAIETSDPLIRAGEHKLSVALGDAPLGVEADPVRLVQVFSNLLNNAAKYTPPGGHIEIVARRCGDRAFVSVRDDGVGIAPELLPQIFDLFTQSSRGAGGERGGIGVGLALVRSFVEMHGGVVEGASEGLGRGSEFLVRLPLSP